jgi:hypothetical protein
VRYLRNRQPFGPGFAGAALAAAAVVVALAAGLSPARAQDTAAAPEGPATQRRVFANYYYGYQAAGRKPLPAQGVRTPQGLSLLTHHPDDAVGPWMSYARSQWHREQLQEMAETGIDVALVVFRGDAASRQGHALKGLDALAQALKEQRYEAVTPFGKERKYPFVGLALDLGGLAAQYGGPVDLKNGDVQKSLYGMIREFYLHVPQEFRAVVHVPAGRAGAGATGLAHIVRLFDDAAVKDADNSFIEAITRRFAQEFGAGLVWIGTPALRAKASMLDSAVPYPGARQAAAVSQGSWLKSATFGPGYDDTAQGAGGTIRPRENGQQIIQDVRRLTDVAPDWVFLDSWNGYGQGTDVAPSLEGPLPGPRAGRCCRAEAAGGAGLRAQRPAGLRSAHDAGGADLPDGGGRPEHRHHRLGRLQPGLALLPVAEGRQGSRRSGRGDQQ